MKKTKLAFIYRNIYIYRLLMNLLYLGKYKKRTVKVRKIIESIILNTPFSDSKLVLDLCFGDVILAQQLKAKKIDWIGYDLNEKFVLYAKSKGLNAYQADLTKIDSLPKSSMCVMMGSLYHFHDQLPNLLSLMFQSTNHILISEPIKNISQIKGPLGKLAQRQTAVRGREENFRYDLNSLSSQLDRLKLNLNFNYNILDKRSKDAIFYLQKNKN